MHPSGFMSAVAYNAASPSTFTQPVTMNQMYHIGVSNGNPVFNTSPQQPAVMAITNSPSLPSMLPLSHPQAAVPNMALMSQHHMQIAATHNTDHTNYILSAFRVGMLALETYGCRIIDDRPQAKYNRNPSCKEDIKWLLNLSMKLGPCYTGPSYLQQFCQMAINSLLSPFVLYDIATEIANTQTRNSPAQFQSIFRTPMLNALMQRCVQISCWGNCLIDNVLQTLIALCVFAYRIYLHHKRYWNVE
ncbi:ZSWIM8 [Bugula neritina]|nr:ZSWIM8 [Bugula neritina]